MQLLVDTDYATNLLSNIVFDTLSRRAWALLEESISHRLQSDGTQIPFYGVIQLPIRVRDVKTEETFVVSRISVEAILGMPFLAAHNCHLNFAKPVLRIDGRELTCTDRHGRLMMRNIQLLQKLTLPLRTNMTLRFRVTAGNFSSRGI